MFKRIGRFIAELLTPDVAGSLTHQVHGPWIIDADLSYDRPGIIPARIAESGNEAAQDYVASLSEARAAFRTQFGTPYQYGKPFSMPTESPLEEWDHETRRDVLETCHAVWQRDPIANAAVTYNRLFAVQDGMIVNYQNDDVQAVIKAFLDNPENAISVYEKLFLDQLQVDGELFVRFFTGDSDKGEGLDSDVVIVPLRPWEIRDIKHEKGFMRRVEHYEYYPHEDDGTGSDINTESENIPAADVLHVYVNAMGYEQRGRPELFRLLPWLRAWKEWLEQRARVNWVRNALVWDITLKNAQASQVSSKRAQYKQPPIGPAMAIHNDNEEWNLHTANVGASDAAEDGRQMKMQIAAGMRLGEYFLGDGSNANLASATAQQLPALRSFAEWQDVMAQQVWEPILRRVVQRAVKASALPETVKDAQGEDILAEKAFSVGYAPLEDNSPTDTLQALSAATMNEWISDQTATRLLPTGWNVDYHEEQALLAEEREKRMAEIDAGLRMAPPQVGQDQQGEPGGNNEPAADEQNQTDEQENKQDG